MAVEKEKPLGSQIARGLGTAPEVEIPCRRTIITQIDRPRVESGWGKRSSQDELRQLTQAVWRVNDNEGTCPDDKYPSFSQLDDLITTTAWGNEAREEFFRRWQTLDPADDTTVPRGGSISELAHLRWSDAREKDPHLLHPLAPLVAAWQSGPLEVQGRQGRRRPPEIGHDSPQDRDAG